MLRQAVLSTERGNDSTGGIETALVENICLNSSGVCYANNSSRGSWRGKASRGWVRMWRVSGNLPFFVVDCEKDSLSGLFLEGRMDVIDIGVEEECQERRDEGQVGCYYGGEDGGGAHL